jgi:hypothetical protein
MKNQLKRSAHPGLICVRAEPWVALPRIRILADPSVRELQALTPPGISHLQLFSKALFLPLYDS